MSKSKKTYENKTVEEFLGKPPKWIIRWGITVLFIIISILFGASYFIPISDEIQLPLQSIDSQDREIIASSEWFVHEVMNVSDSNVKKNSPIIRISKGFTYQELNLLKQSLETNNLNKNILGELNILMEKDSLILSPIDGKLEFTIPIKSGQSVPSGTLLAKVISPRSRLVEASTASLYYQDIKHIKTLPVFTSSGNIIQAIVKNIIVEGDLMKIQIAIEPGLEILTAKIRVNRQMLFDKLFKRKSN